VKRHWILLLSFLIVVIAAIILRGPVHTGPLKTVYKNSYTSPQEFMEGLYAVEQKSPKVEGETTRRIRAIVVPHHLVSSAAIATGFVALKGQSFKKIVMITPDHFFQCEKTLCTTNAVYETFFGNVSADVSTVSKLIASPIVSDNPKLFKAEHGIFADVPFAAKLFPGVKVTPIALNTTNWKLQQKEIKELIESVLDEQTVLVISSDFSHYLPLEKSNEMDEQTAETIFAKDFDGISKLNNADQSDCLGCLWALASIANDRGFYNPSVRSHTNSATILQDEKIPETTSHFTMVWYENDTLDEHDVAFAGDVTVTRGNARRLPEEIKQWWAGDGERVVNLEGPLSIECVPDERWYVFCNPMSRFAQIKNLATHFGIMNNHMLDQRVSGVDTTKLLLEKAGKTPIGTQMVETDTMRVVALTEIMNPIEDAAFANISKTEQTVLQDLRDHPSDKLTVVYVHGGDEYFALTSDAWTKRWEQFIDAGADAVIVVHTHVPGDMVFYKNKPIFRGLGNFVFDQYDAISKQSAKLVRLRKENGEVKFETLTADVR
jgi:AmmeMemoRadiSam system protein B